MNGRRKERRAEITLTPRVPGVHVEGQNRDGGEVASGAYFVHVRQGERYAAVKLILMR
jgi:hypothetical protein